MDESHISINTLREKQVRLVLDRLYEPAKRDKVKLLRMVPRFLIGFVKGKGIEEILTPEMTKDIYITISPQQGKKFY
jgi:hypothetical protein